MKRNTILLTAFGLTMITSAAAEEPGFYAGVAPSRSATSNLTANEANNALIAAGYANPVTVVDRRDNGFRYFAGYSFSPYFAMELAELDIGNFSTRTTVSNGTVNAIYVVKASSLDALFVLPLKDQYNAFVRAGISNTRMDARFTATGAVQLAYNRAKKDRVATHYGVGIQHDLTSVFAVRAEVERFPKLGDDSTGGELRLTTFSAGIVVRF
jgi:hypothetical protein